MLVREMDMRTLWLSCTNFKFANKDFNITKKISGDSLKCLRYSKIGLPMDCSTKYKLEVSLSYSAKKGNGEKSWKCSSALN